jgi:hypothetical protein
MRNEERIANTIKGNHTVYDFFPSSVIVHEFTVVFTALQLLVPATGQPIIRGN